MRIVVDEQFRWRADGLPYLFLPSIDWASFREPNITEAYCANSVFFCCAEHAVPPDVPGQAVSLADAPALLGPAQAKLFGFTL